MNVEPIIKARFKRFKDSYDLDEVQDGIAFERFVNHAILSAHQPDAFSADEELLDLVCVGGENDMGIDGVAIKLNGLLIRSVDDVSDIIEKFNRASVEFIFIQSKYKPKFETGEFSKFVNGVRDFLDEKQLQPMNDDLKVFLELKEYLFSENVMIMWENNPSVRLYYVAMGRWRDSQHHIAISERLKCDLAELNSYLDPEIHFIDSEGLKNICDSNDNTFTASIHTIDTMPLTPVNDVANSCIALCDANEFAKLIVTDDNIIRKSLFNDNVRDFQGLNGINNEIQETINNEPDKFALLNNGITVVCDDYMQSNRRITMKNPQIVNGCQTSHVLHQAYVKGVDVSTMPLNIKIIATKNFDIINQIVRGTNRQNIVYDEAFETTKKFHKDLEEFFDACSQDYMRLYYERRSKQYHHDPRIKQTQKINLRILTQSFVSMFMDKPHVAHRHESRLLRNFSNSIFLDHHSRLPYFTAALTFYLLESHFREGRSDKKTYYTYRSHILTILRELIGGKSPNLNSEKETDKYCKNILDKLNNKENCEKMIIKSLEYFDYCKDYWVNVLGKSTHGIKDNEGFTTLILEEARKNNRVSNCKSVERFRGKVIKIIVDKYGKYCGFIERNPNNIFFHSRQNENLDFVSLEGKLVDYEIDINKRNNLLIAISVRLAKS